MAKAHIWIHKCDVRPARSSPTEIASGTEPNVLPGSNDNSVGPGRLHARNRVVGRGIVDDDNLHLARDRRKTILDYIGRVVKYGHDRHIAHTYRRFDERTHNGLPSTGSWPVRASHARDGRISLASTPSSHMVVDGPHGVVHACKAGSHTRCAVDTDRHLGRLPPTLGAPRRALIDDPVLIRARPLACTARGSAPTPRPSFVEQRPQ